jgi:hypothetical protein
MWQRAFVLEYASKITAINPPATGRTADEMLGLVRDRLAGTLAPVSSARYHKAKG